MVCALDPSKRGTHCTHCFALILANQPCVWCAEANFCSIACRDLALRSYHRYECPLGMVTRLAGLDAVAMMALRAVTRFGLDGVLKVSSQPPPSWRWGISEEWSRLETAKSLSDGFRQSRGNDSDQDEGRPGKKEVAKAEKPIDCALIDLASKLLFAIRSSFFGDFVNPVGKSEPRAEASAGKEKERKRSGGEKHSVRPRGSVDEVQGEEERGSRSHPRRQGYKSLDFENAFHHFAPPPSDDKGGRTEALLRRAFAAAFLTRCLKDMQTGFFSSGETLKAIVTCTFKYYI